jgi:hypothetical protein
VYFKDETEWLTQKALAKLFDVGRTVITKHLRNIFKEGELAENSICANLHILLRAERYTKPATAISTPSSP